MMVTIIADNYYGYCKKEVKTQISFAANLLRPVRRRACRRRDRVSRLCSGPGVLCRPHRAHQEGRRSTRPCVWLGDRVEIAARRLRDRPAVSGHLLRPGERRVQRARGLGQMAAATETGTTLTLRAGRRLRAALGYQDPAGKADSAARPGGWSASRAARHPLP